MAMLSNERFFLRCNDGYQKLTAFTSSLATSKEIGTAGHAVRIYLHRALEGCSGHPRNLTNAVATPDVPFKGAIDDRMPFKVYGACLVLSRRIRQSYSHFDLVSYAAGRQVYQIR